MEGMIRPTEHASLGLSSPDEFGLEGSREKRLPTPLDNLGKVDGKALIRQVKLAASPEVNRDHNEDNDCHHLYWPKSMYHDKPRAAVNPAEFRELPLNKIVIPVDLHWKIHNETEQPEVPDDEFMHRYIEAHRITKALYKNSWHAIRLERKRWTPDDKLHRGRRRHLVESRELLKRARLIPKPYQPIDFDLLEPSSIEDVQALAHQLGQYAIAANSLVRYSRLDVW